MSINHINRPHCFLRENNGHFYLRVLIESNSNRSFSVTPVPYKDGETEWNFEFIEGTCNTSICSLSHSFEAEAVPIDPTQPMSIQNFIAQVGMGTFSYFGRQYILDAREHTGMNFDYAPHLYLTKPEPLDDYFLFIALELPENVEIQELICPGFDPVTQTRTFHIITHIVAGTPAGIKRIPMIEFKRCKNEEHVEVVVFDTNNVEAEKGKVRHAIADNKPFDLDDL